MAGALVFVGFVVAVVGSLGAPLITAVAEHYAVSLAAAQWTLTIALFAGAIGTPLLGRLGSGPRRRGTVLAALGVVTAGSLLTVLPLPFALLLVGRAAQGTGLGLTALMMATARDHLDGPRAARTIALLSVTSTVGIGLGYPVAGLLTDLGGIRAAYGVGLAVAAAALVTAWRVLPQAPARPVQRIDLRGALLLTVALLGLLVAVSQTDLWRRHAALAGGMLGASLLLLVVWTVLETRTHAPIVDVRLLREPAVALANAAMFTGGIGMYLLLSLITRYVQTRLDAFEAGLVLVPFSLLGFVAGRILPRLQGRLGARTLLAGSAAVVLVAFVLFALARGPVALPVTAMAVLGFGVGGFFAATPAIILAATPPAETASAMSVNQVVRSVGFSIGSALGGLILAAHTSGVFPQERGYATAAWVGAGIMALTLFMIIGAPLVRRRRRAEAAMLVNPPI